MKAMLDEYNAWKSIKTKIISDTTAVNSGSQKGVVVIAPVNRGMVSA